MNSLQPITLFADLQPTSGSPSSLTVSLAVHTCALVVLAFLLNHMPRVSERRPERHYIVRTLTLHDSDPQLHWSGQTGGGSPADPAKNVTAQVSGSAMAASRPQQLLSSPVPARQTLIQPDAPPKVVLPRDTRIPLLLLTSRERILTPKIIPPPPQKPSAVTPRPTLALPNHEARAADIQLASSHAASQSFLVASTTSPVSMPVQGAVQLPETSSKKPALPSPATVMSISSVILPEGKIAVPLANEVAAVSLPKSPEPERNPNPSNVGHGGIAAKQNGVGSGANGTQSGKESAAANQAAGKLGGGSGQSSGTKTGPNSGFASAHNTGLGAGQEADSLAEADPRTTRLTLSKTGKFGVVVVGSSVAEEYPETLGIWADRLAYTVYLHMGLAKNWILQYALSNARQIPGANRPDAPWPYSMVRPDLAPGDLNADAILVHGFINVAGRFDQLAVVYPPQFAQTKFVLGALQQWQFRPAMQNGQTTPVEVLLIIPDELE
ncbi:MAG TPA: hypothetical protein VFN53_08275 [Acidobacteriaceae bacterium]|nr:hypothetical protein [Acidobacteriaceae bacterium]